MTGKFISYHAFTWATAKNRFVKSILKANGDIEQEAKEKGKYLVKVSNPNHQMKDHPKWQQSNNNYWKKPFISFKPIQEAGAFTN